MILNIVVYTFIFFVSVIPIKGMCNVYYGVLRGSQIVKYKSPFPGIVNLSNIFEGDIFNSECTLFSVHNHEYISKRDIINKKKEMETRKLTGLKDSRKHLAAMFVKGFISKKDLQEIEQEINNVELSIMSLDIESKNIESLLRLSSPSLSAPFIIRDIFVTDGQYVNSG
ncbi:hypothetical protein AAS46_004715, partial [Escherichia coli]|nr:hypothetical protein [Escherichia coli]